MMLCAHNELPEWCYVEIDGKVSLEEAFIFVCNSSGGFIQLQVKYKVLH